MSLTTVGVTFLGAFLSLKGLASILTPAAAASYTGNYDKAFRRYIVDAVPDTNVKLHRNPLKADDQEERHLSSSLSKSSGSSKSSKGSQKSSKGSKIEKSPKNMKEKEKHYHPRRRRCKNLINAWEGTAELKCLAMDEERVSDEITFFLTAGGEGLLMDVVYSTEATNETESLITTTNAQYEIKIHGLVEYFPTGDDDSDAFDAEEDEVVQKIPFDEWDLIQRPSRDAEGVYSFSVSTFDGGVTFYFHLAEEDLDDRDLSANRIKIGIEIDEFPFEQNDTLVALLATVGSRTEVESHYDDEEENYHATDVMVYFGLDENAPFGELTWVKTAEVNDGEKSCDVVATLISGGYDGEQNEGGDWEQSDEEQQSLNFVTADNTGNLYFEYEDQYDVNSQRVAFSFLNSSLAEKIYWDPKVGVRYPDEVISAGFAAASTLSESSSTSTVPSFALVSIFVVAGSLVALL